MNVYPEIEAIMIKFCRRQLGVGSRTPIPAVIGECGMVGVHIDCKLKCLKYWIRLISQPQDNLLRACYNMLFLHCNAGRKNWASQVKNMLYEFGFGYIWELQAVYDEVRFIDDFRNRLLDCEKQTWRAAVTNMPKLELYSVFKLELKTEMYLLLDMQRKYRVALAKLRVGNHELEIEKGRQCKKKREERICRFCHHGIEDEYHVIFDCNLYNEIREAYIKDEYKSPSNLYTFGKLLSSENDTCIVNLSKFVYYMFTVRKDYIT